MILKTDTIKEPKKLLVPKFYHFDQLWGGFYHTELVSGSYLNLLNRLV